MKSIKCYIKGKNSFVISKAAAEEHMMVVVDGKKYACETCIKGHRSSACKHTDRPLFEIKRKGRPVTQCEHCRELRKTKQVHVKCICESREDDAGEASGSRKDHFPSFPLGFRQ